MGYACSYCDNQYRNPGDLKRHSLEQHKDVTQARFMKKFNLPNFLIKLDVTALRCTVCGANVDSLNEIISHLSEVHAKTIHVLDKNYILPFDFRSDLKSCALCSHVLNSFKKLLEHTTSHYTNFTCDKCSAGFINSSALKSHYHIHTDGAYKCSYCPKILKHLRQKHNHEKVHRHKNMLYKCWLCAEAFNADAKRIRHLNEAHGVVPDLFKCRACVKTFKNRKAYKSHIKRDHLMERQHACKECEKSFFRAEQLREHMVKHTGLKQYECDMCSKRFGAKGSLRKHMRRHEYGK